MRAQAPRVVSFAALVGLAVSAWMFVQYILPPAQAACGPGGGCHAVRMCKLGQMTLAHMPFWPLLGMISFGALLIMSLIALPRVRVLLPVAGVSAIVIGTFLIVSQKVYCHAICPYCLATDSAALVAGIASIVGRKERVEFPWWWRIAFGAMGILAVMAPLSWLMAKNARGETVGQSVQQLPAPIAREQRPGLVTLVEFADFECPYCRRQHLELSEVLPAFGNHVRLVRKHVPLRFHQHAEPAARAAICAEAQGRGDAMADHLFRVDEDNLTAEDAAHFAETLNMDMHAYTACLTSPETRARLSADHEAATDSGVQGLPTMFVGHTRFEGVVEAETLRRTIQHALTTSE